MQAATRVKELLMHTRSFIPTCLFGLVLFILGGLAMGQTAAQTPQQAQSPTELSVGSFTYQGELSNNGASMNGMCDFQFGLYSVASGGTQLGTTYVINGVSVQNGRFTVELDASVSGPFGNDAFTGTDRWLSIAVRCPSGSGVYTPLNPRQKITAAPYALSLKPGAVISGNASTGLTVGVFDGTGIVASSATGFGLVAGSNSNVGIQGSSFSSYGIRGISNSSIGVQGTSDNGGTGVDGTGVNGVKGTSLTTNGNGVYGIANNGPSAFGVWGTSTVGQGVVGSSNTGNGMAGYSTNSRGVYGSSTNNIGVYGYGAMGGVQGFSGSETGVYGNSTSGSGIVGYGGGNASVNYPSIWGISDHANPAVTGQQSGTGTGSGVEGVALSGNGVVGASQTGYAGAFYGDVSITGALYAAVKNFRIDHPLDPGNQYLQHAAVESAEMKTMYDGIATLDADGQAMVTLPDWFEGLNGDFRYQLTAINAPGPSLYIAAEVKDHRFTIAGGSAGMKVSWQVTGVRHDPYALANPLEVEVAKPDIEQGTYLMPEGYDKSPSRGVDEQFRQSVEQRADPATVLQQPTQSVDELERELQRKLEQK